MTEFFTLGLLILFSAMLPGPDFAVVTKNTLLHSRKAGLFTSLGISTAILIHVTYCSLGLAIVISQSTLLFNSIKWVGAIYLIYLGINAFRFKSPMHLEPNKSKDHKNSMSSLVAFRQGFFTNLFNPKATLFLLALFTVLIKPETSGLWLLGFAIEIFTIVTVWFCLLTLILSHPVITRGLARAEKYIAKVLGCSLIAFGVALSLVNR